MTPPTYLHWFWQPCPSSGPSPQLNLTWIEDDICCRAAHFLPEVGEPVNVIVRWPGCSWFWLDSRWRGVITGRIAASRQCSTLEMQFVGATACILSSCCAVMGNNANARILCSNKTNNSANKDCLAPKRGRGFWCWAKVERPHTGFVGQIWQEGRREGRRGYRCMLPRDSEMSKQSNFSRRFYAFYF